MDRLTSRRSAISSSDGSRPAGRTASRPRPVSVPAAPARAAKPSMTARVTAGAGGDSPPAATRASRSPGSEAITLVAARRSGECAARRGRGAIRPQRASLPKLTRKSFKHKRLLGFTLRHISYWMAARSATIGVMNSSITARCAGWSR